MAENKSTEKAQELTKTKLPAAHLKPEMRHYRGQQRQENLAFMYRL